VHLADGIELTAVASTSRISLGISICSLTSAFLSQQVAAAIVNLLLLLL